MKKALYRYPEATQEDVVEDYHGMLVEDPFRWLEDPENPETKRWTAAQNSLTEAFLADEPAYQKIQDRLTELWRFPHYTTVYEKGERTFFTKNSGTQNQPALYMQQGDDDPVLLVDPNTLSDDGTVALMVQSYTKDGKLLAYSLSESGSDWQRIKILDLDTLQHYEEELTYTKFPNMVWDAGKTGFFYNRLPDPDTVAPEDRNNFRFVAWHTLGTPQSEDVKVFQHADKTLGVYPVATDDNKYLVLWVYRGTDSRNGLYYRLFDGEGDFVRLFDVEEAEYALVGSQGDVFYIQTDLDAPNGRIVAVDLIRPERENWREVIPEGEDAIFDVSMVDNKLVVTTFHHAYHQIKYYDLDGNLLGDIPLPTLGTATPISGGQQDKRYYFSFASFLYPDTIFYFDLETETLVEFADDQGIDFDISDYVTSQVFYTSMDGTKVPMFLTHKKGIELDGNNPTILYGYGGFNIAQTPFFKVWNLTWFEMGGVFALANLRGGNEFGEEWHQAGMLDRKQNVFDDMHAAAEWLIENNYTRTEKLAIEGRSNGGLLTAACMLQRPDLYGAVLCHVPVIDMLRYHKFTLGHFWTPEYGNAEENAEHFEFLYAYSPLHNVKEGTLYPPVIVTTADTDDRVVPAHSKKFIATLQAEAAPYHPYLLRVETRAGHGLGKPISKLIEERTDVWAFAVKVLGMDV